MPYVEVNDGKHVSVHSLRVRPYAAIPALVQWEFDPAPGHRMICGYGRSVFQAQAGVLRLVLEAHGANQLHPQFRANVFRGKDRYELFIRVIGEQPIDFKWINTAPNRRKALKKTAPDAYAILAASWNVPRDVAKQRAYEIAYGMEKTGVTQI